MSRFQNFTGKIYLRPIVYPGDDKITYCLPQEEADKAFAAGLPEIELEGVAAKSSAPKIAVILTRDQHPDRQLPDYSLPLATAEAVTLSGGKICPVGYDKVAGQLAAIRPDGVFLPGGVFDVPLDWEENEPEHPIDLRRFNVYREVIDYAKEHKLPLLAVCGGMQVLACCFGAKIGRIEGHRTNIKDFAHKMEIKQNSLLQKITGASEMEVNSWHTWAVSKDNIGNNLAHTSPDGIVEAIEPVNPWHPFVLGIQSHPEYFVKKGYAAADKIFKSFIKAAEEKALSKQKSAFSMLTEKGISRG